jgi:protein gp37
MNGPNNAIGWTDYTWNPMTGCEFACRFGEATCYAEGIARRFAGGKAFPRGFKPTFHPERLSEPQRVKTPARIFAVSMGDLFGSWVPPDWIAAVLEACCLAPWHTFILCTKAPWNAAKWTMPDNVWIGATVTGKMTRQPDRLEAVKHYRAPVRFLSCEPLEGPLDVGPADPDWIIIGAATGPGGFQPNEAWVAAIEEYADSRAIPLYHKSNLKIRPEKRHEWPTWASAKARRERTG